jgi:Domain of unknown function (DUF4158)
MPISILTPHQRDQYGRFPAIPPKPEQIAKHCFLAPDEIAQVVARRPQTWHQLGFAIQLMTVRFLGTFLDEKDALKVPPILATFAAQQLRLREMPNMSGYTSTMEVVRSHRRSIREQFGYTEFSDALKPYGQWLTARILRAGDTQLELFDLSTAWCIDKKVLLPAATTLERMIASTHDATLQGLWTQMSDVAKRGGRSDQLLGLLAVSGDTGRTQLDELQRAPTRQNTNGMDEGEQRVKRLKQLGVDKLDLGIFPAARLQQMADYAVLAKSSQLNRLQPARKLATLLAFASIYEVIATDDFLDLFDVMMSSLLSKSEARADLKRLDGLDQLDAAALVLALACEVVVNEDEVGDREVRPVIYRAATRDELLAAVGVIRAQCHIGRRHDVFDALAARHRMTAGVVGPIVRTLTLKAGPNGQQILRLVAFIKRIQSDPKTDFSGAPLDGLSKTWRAHVLDAQGRVRKHGYIAWAATRLRDGLRRHDIFVDGLATASARFCTVRLCPKITWLV